ncbi:LysR substrate-binding domain-containing protein [Aromatoleum toluolicum]|uniref:LysR family transcriptional regulator n=1 Tax=Aromatoleum toluolicum TaxID=90060 RepID=A0ABX1NC94_9RHOO|nr:LysR substrate-binding domain-containing protein [Aromatoleum toluolicum]NMF96915.1 LysR substrate-binding domain-containing protein [Aromatoleum toluolicum]
MSRSRLSLPPLNALRTFEAAARHGSFKMAAEELCVTQAAVSRQIQALEEFYRLSLFARSNRKVELTEDGHALYLATSSALQHIATASRDLLRRNSRDDELYLITTSAFAQLWLMPRLKRLRAQYRDLQLFLISSEGNPDFHAGFDAAVTLGLEEHPQYVADYLFAEEIFPVCTPEFFEQHPQISTLEGLLTVPLLNLSASHWKAKLWTPIDWAFWLQQFGCDAPTSKMTMNFSHFPMLLDAVQQEAGVGLAWRHLVQQQLEEGKLVRPTGATYFADDRKHYFVCRRELVNSKKIQIFRDWLMAQTRVLRERSDLPNGDRSSPATIVPDPRP